MAQLVFGAGALWGERTNKRDPVTGFMVAADDAGPIQFGITQKASVNWAYTDKKVYGQQQFPIAIVRGQGSVDGKAANAQFNMLLFSDLFFGLTPLIGHNTIAQDEVATLVSNSYVPLNAGTFAGDLGVKYSDSGDHFQRFNSPAAAGQYAIVDSIYAFNNDDVGKEVLISYHYTVAGSGRGLLISNRQQGITPTWKATFFHETSPGQAGAGTTDQPFSLHLNACVSSKLTLPNSAIDSWTIPELDFEACADEDGNVGLLSMIQP